MPSYEQYVASGYSHAVAEQLAEQDEADLARRAVEMNAEAAPPPSNPAFWFEGSKLAETQPPVGGAGSGRFADLDRMAQEERDEAELAEQRVAVFEREHPPVRPDRVVQLHGRECSVFLGANALAANQRDARIKELREGGRR